MTFLGSCACQSVDEVQKPASQSERHDLRRSHHISIGLARPGKPGPGVIIPFTTDDVIYHLILFPSHLLATLASNQPTEERQTEPALAPALHHHVILGMAPLRAPSTSARSPSRAQVLHKLQHDSSVLTSLLWSNNTETHRLSTDSFQKSMNHERHICVYTDEVGKKRIMFGEE